MATSSIEWTHKTWNPITGCSRVSAGCDHCYAMMMARRHDKREDRSSPYDGTTRNTNGVDWTGRINVIEERFEEPLSWEKPRRVFVNSMGDLFHPSVPEGAIDRVFSVMREAGRHQFQILTKRPERAAELDSELQWSANIWMGTSVEDASALGRLDELRRTSASIKFASFEPLIGPLPDDLDLTGIDWAIVGGESGPHGTVRRMEPDWARTVRDRCQKSGTAFFFKQWGAYNAAGERVGKKKAGRELDGRTWDEFPR